MVGFSSHANSPLRRAGSNCASSPFSSAGCQSGNAARHPRSGGWRPAARKAKPRTSSVAVVAVAEVGHDGRQIRTRDDVEQLLFIGRKARPDLAQVVDRVDVGNDGVVARPFQPLVVETAARTLADYWRLWHRNCAE